MSSTSATPSVRFSPDTAPSAPRGPESEHKDNLVDDDAQPLRSRISSSSSSTFGLLAAALSKPRPHSTWLLHLASITPLICASFGPVVTLLALSGCADRWRVFDNGNGTVFDEPDPPWVVATTVTAIVVGLVANTFMLLRMVGRGHPKWDQNISIVLWLTECATPPRQSKQD